MEKIKIEEVVVEDNSISAKAREGMVSDIENYLKSIPKLHKGICYLHKYFLKECLKCKYLGHLYNMTWWFQTYELELNHVVSINNLDVEEVQEVIEELLERYDSYDDTLDRMLEEIVDRFNRVDEYEVFEHWER